MTTKNIDTLNAEIKSACHRKEYDEGARLCRELCVLCPTPETKVLLAKCLRNLGYGLRIEGKYEDAKRSLCEAQTIYRSLGQLNEDFKIGMAINLCESALENVPEAMQGFLSLLSQCKNPATRQALVTDKCDLNTHIPKIKYYLSINYAKQGLWKEALENVRQACKDFTDEYYIGQCLEGEGIALAALGHYAEALLKYRAARKAYETSGHRQKLLLLDEHTALALCKAGRQNEAIPLLDDCIARGKKTDQPRALPFFYRAQCRRTLGQFRAALDDYQAAIDLVEHRRGGIALDYYRQSYLDRFRKIYEEALLFCVEQGYAAEGYAILQLAAARIFNEHAVGGPNSFLLELPEFRALKTIESEMDALYARLDRDSSTDDGTARLLGIKEQEYERALRALKDKHPQTADLAVSSPVDIPALQKTIDPKSAVIHYFSTQDHLVIYALTATGIRCAVSKISKLSLDEAVRNATQWVFTVESAGSPQYRQLRLDAMDWYMSLLYRQLLGPVDDLLADKSKLVIIPSNGLHFLPFSLLRNGAGKHIWELCELRFAPGPRHIGSSVDTIKVGSSILVVANPTGDLCFADDEAKAIVKVIPAAKVLSGRDATKQAILKELSQHKVIHIACHARSNPDNPLFSELVVAGPNGKGQTRITVNDIMHSRLSTDLVVLSGCETGISDVANGDELTGFSRAFLAAGAKCVLVSLWQIDDASTAQFMEYFYRGLMLRKKPPVWSLYYTHFKMNNDKYTPYHWAGFQVAG